MGRSWNPFKKNFWKNPFKKETWVEIGKDIVSADSWVSNKTSGFFVDTFGRDKGEEIERMAKDGGADWMSKLDNNKYLADLSIPGTHDSLTFTATGSPQAQCQHKDATIYAQLMSGVRFLDVRVSRDWHGYHGIIRLTTNFEETVKDCEKFLTDSPNEVIIMRVKTETDVDGTPNSFKEGFDKYVKNNSVFFRKANAQNKKLNDLTLGDARGKIIVLSQIEQDCEDYFNKEGIGYTWREATSKFREGNDEIEVIQDKYDDPGFSGKFYLVRDFILKHHDHSHRAFRFNFVSATGGGIEILVNTPGKYNTEVKDKLIPWLRNEGKGKRVHVLVWDYVLESNKPKLVFERNF